MTRDDKMNLIDRFEHALYQPIWQNSSSLEYFDFVERVSLLRGFEDAVDIDIKDLVLRDGE